METTKTKELSTAQAQKLLDTHDFNKSIELNHGNEYIYPLGRRHFIVIHKGQQFYDWHAVYLMNYLQTIIYLSFGINSRAFIKRDYWGYEESFNPLETAKGFAGQYHEVLESLNHGKYLIERTDYFSGDYSMEILNPDKIRVETKDKEFYVEIKYGRDYISKKWYAGFYVMLPSKGVTGCTGHGRPCEFVYENLLHGVWETPGFSSKKECIEYYINRTINEMHGVSILMERCREDIEKTFPKVYDELTTQLNKYLPQEKQTGQTCLF